MEPKTRNHMGRRFLATALLPLLAPVAICRTWNYACLRSCTPNTTWRHDAQTHGLISTDPAFPGCLDTNTEQPWYNVISNIDRCRGGGKVLAQRWYPVPANGSIMSDFGTSSPARPGSFGLATCLGASCAKPPQVWLQRFPSANCSAHGNCRFDNTSSGQLKNPSTGQCLAVCNGHPGAPRPQTSTVPTCDPASPAAKERFCDEELSFEERAAALVAKLSLQEKAMLWTVNGMGAAVPHVNLKGYTWDHTCVHGFTAGGWGGGTATAFPHAINQGASFDAELVGRLSAVTALEARAINVQSLNKSGGQKINGVNCDGGPLANNAHDPRW